MASLSAKTSLTDLTNPPSEWNSVDFAWKIYQAEKAATTNDEKRVIEQAKKIYCQKYGEKAYRQYTDPEVIALFCSLSKTQIASGSSGAQSAAAAASVASRALGENDNKSNAKESKS